MAWKNGGFEHLSTQLSSSFVRTLEYELILAKLRLNFVLRTLSIKRNEFLSVYKKYTYSCHYHYWSWKSDARCNCLLKSQASGCSRFHKSKLRKHYAVSTRYHKLFRRYTTQSKKKSSLWHKARGWCNISTNNNHLRIWGSDSKSNVDSV